MKTTIRSVVQRDNPFLSELGKSIEALIEPICEKRDFEGDVQVHVYQSYVHIWIKSNYPWMNKEFSDFIEDVSNNVSPMIATLGYFYNNQTIKNLYVILKFPKSNGTEKIQDRCRTMNLQNFIMKAINETYLSYNELSTAEVKIDKTNIQIMFNSETPYLGKQFWNLLNQISEAIDDKLKQAGYNYKRTEVLYDYIIWHYTTSEEKKNTDSKT